MHTEPVRFYLGCHQPAWLDRSPVPLFVSHRRLAMRRTHGRAVCDWALDSGGFTELALHGGWSSSPVEYATAVRRYRDEIGGLAWAAPQDWVCAPAARARTGLSVAEHQRRTTANYIELCSIDPALPFVPVLQGWEPDDYRRHVDDYAAAGVELDRLPLVGLGSIVQRSAESSIVQLVWELADDAGLALHGFGVKLGGLRRFGRALASADSLAWSYNARRNPALPGCSHRSCSNCLRWALRWRERALAVEQGPWQPELGLYGCGGG